MVVVLSSLDDAEQICKPVPFMDIEKAIKSSVGTTTPVFSVSKTLKRLLITTSASALAKIFSMNKSSDEIKLTWEKFSQPAGSSEVCLWCPQENQF